jgi:hypothetical protein
LGVVAVSFWIAGDPAQDGIAMSFDRNPWNWSYQNPSETVEFMRINTEEYRVPNLLGDP